MNTITVIFKRAWFDNAYSRESIIPTRVVRVDRIRGGIKIVGQSAASFYRVIIGPSKLKRKLAYLKVDAEVYLDNNGTRLAVIKRSKDKISVVWFNVIALPINVDPPEKNGVFLTDMDNYIDFSKAISLASSSDNPSLLQGTN